MNQENYYHIYNRGAHRAETFLDDMDYLRMLKLLYIANNDEPFVLSQLPENVYSIERKQPLVEIAAYCLMPNHIHIALRKNGGGVGLNDNLSRFVHKLMTGYSSYFNKKYRHSGTIWQGPFKTKDVCDDLYVQTLIRYIHLNPCDLVALNENESEEQYRKKILDFAVNYEYSSLKDYLGIIRPQRAILEASPLGGLASWK